MKNSMNSFKNNTTKQKAAGMLGEMAKGVAKASSDKCFFISFHEPKMPKSLYKQD